MKVIIYTTIIACSIFTNQLKCQLWENSSAKIVACWWNFGFNGIDSIYNAGDTIINNHTYAKIIYKTDYYWQSPAIEYAYTTQNKLHIRKSNDSLLLRNTVSNTDGLIVYFGLQVGEQYQYTAAVDSLYNGAYLATLDSISSYIFQGNNYRRFYFHILNNPSLDVTFLPSANLDAEFPISFINPKIDRSLGVFDELFGLIEFKKLVQPCYVNDAVCESYIYKDYQYYEGEDSLRDNYMNCQSIVLETENVKIDKKAIIYPNPLIENKLNIKFNLPTEGNLMLLNSLGSVVMQKSFTKTNQLEISLNELNAGVYFCRISSQGLPILTERVVKVR